MQPTEDEDPAAPAVAEHERAIALREAGLFHEAERAVREAVRLFAAAEGGQSPNLASALVEHGRLLELLDRLEEADAAHARALAILRPLIEEPTTDNEPEIVEELVRLTARAEAARGSTLRARGLLREAEAAYSEVLRLVEARLPAGDLLIAEILNGLGVVYKFLGRYGDAEPLYRRALAIVEAAGQTDDEATLLHNLGGLAHARGDFAAGEPLARRSVELRESLLGADHPTVAADRANWGALLEGLGRLDEAERAYADALGVFEARLGPDSLEAASAWSALGAVQHSRGALDEAERSYRRARVIREARLGPEHFDLALTLHNLGMLLDDRGARAEALALLRRAHAMFQATLGPDHPHTRAAAGNVAAFIEP
jgi:tetratricopeptide (TPR) repeat protein